MVVGVAEVRVVVAWVLLSVRLRLRARCTGSRLVLLLLLLLRLGRGVWGGVTAVLSVAATCPEARLAVDAGTALRILAQVISLLRCVVTTKRTLLSRNVVLLTMSGLLLGIVVAVVVVGVSILLVGRVVRGIVTRRGAERSCAGLRRRLGSLGWE